MAVTEMRIPVCDVCGEAWLPKKGPNRDDPASNVKRCGKCKSPNWNAGPRELRIRGHVIRPQDPDELDEQDLAEQVLEEASKHIRVERRKLGPYASGPRPKLCIHGLTRCELCHGETR